MPFDCSSVLMTQQKTLSYSSHHLKGREGGREGGEGGGGRGEGGRGEGEGGREGGREGEGGSIILKAISIAYQV